MSKRLYQWVSQLLYADHLWLGIDVAVTLDCRKRLADRRLCGLVGDHDHGRGRAGLLAPEARQFGARSALHDAFQRDALLGHAACNRRKRAGAVVDREPNVIAAFMASHLGLLVGFEILRLGRSEEHTSELQSLRHI